MTEDPAKMDWEQLIEKVLDLGCGCDMIAGYQCGIHQYMSEIQKRFASLGGAVEKHAPKLTLGEIDTKWKE